MGKDQKMPETKLDKFRWYILDEQERRRSETWSIYSNKDDVYLGARSLGGSFKVSLHARGGSRDGMNSQIGLTRRYAEDQTAAGVRKVLQPARWRRPVPTAGRPSLAVVIDHPTDLLPNTYPVPKRDGDPMFALQLAPPGGSVRIGLFFALTANVDDLVAREAHSGGCPLVKIDLPCGETGVIVAKHQSPFTLNIERDEFSKAVRPLAGAPGAGDSVEVGAILWADRPRDGETLHMCEVTGLTLEHRPAI